MAQIFNLFSKKPRLSFTDLIRPYKDYLFSMAYRYTGNRHDAEDLLQELLIDLYNKQQQLASVQNPKGWLSKCLYHKFVDHYRKKQRLNNYEVSNSDIISLSEHNSDSLSEKISGAGLGSQTVHENQILHRQILASLALLSNAQRAVLCLHDIEGYTLPELSEILVKPLGTLKSDLHRAREKIKSRFNLQPSDFTQRHTQHGGK